MDAVDHDKFSTKLNQIWDIFRDFNVKMGFYLITIHNPLLCFQNTWWAQLHMLYSHLFFVYRLKLPVFVFPGEKILKT